MCFDMKKESEIFDQAADYHDLFDLVNQLGGKNNRPYMTVLHTEQNKSEKEKPVWS